MLDILTIKEKIQLFKGESPATSIELLTFNEVDFEVVSAKGRFEVGDKCMFIYPDYNLPDIFLFAEYHRPGGDPSKTKLGSNGRIRAIKFNLHRGDGVPIYSNGVVLNDEELSFFGYSFENTSDDLGITKWEAPDESLSANLKGSGDELPQGMYRTDETNLKSLTRLDFPLTLTARVKIDGSSITLFSQDNDSGICSRNKRLHEKETVITGRRKKTLLEKLTFWKNHNLFTYDVIDSKSEFVKVGLPYLKAIDEFAKRADLQFAFRGELCGRGLKGSGNKNNPHIKLEPQIIFYGGDWYTDGIYRRMTNESFEDFITDLGFQAAPVVCRNVTFNSKNEIYEFANSYFKENLVEGLVFRNEDGTVSFKVMNDEYDSKK